MDVSQYLEIFLDETREHLSSLNTQILNLEQNPEDVDNWYALGELLCKAGRTEEGYKALNRGRSLIKK